MTSEDFLKAFAQMSPEDQDSIRAELTGKAGPLGERNPMATCRGLMEKMKCC